MQLAGGKETLFTVLLQGSELIKLPLVSTTGLLCLYQQIVFMLIPMYWLGSLEVTSLLAANQKQGNFLGQRQISRAFSQTSQTARARQSMEITQVTLLVASFI